MRDALRAHLATLGPIPGRNRHVAASHRQARRLSGILSNRDDRYRYAARRTERLDRCQDLPATYSKRMEGILARTRDGVVVDVCEGTGKQKSLVDYFNRAAILDRDPRGGAMALLFATEMAGLK